MTAWSSARRSVRMEALGYGAIGAVFLLAAYLLFRAGGRFAISTVRRQVAELVRQLDSLEADYASHKKRDAAAASNAVPRRPKAPPVGEVGYQPNTLAELAARDPAAARAAILNSFKENGGGQ